MAALRNLAIAVGTAAARNFETLNGVGIGLQCSGAVYELTPAGHDDILVSDMPVKGSAVYYSTVADRIYFNLWHLGASAGDSGVLLKCSLPRRHTCQALASGCNPDIVAKAFELKLLPISATGPFHHWQTIGNVSGVTLLYSTGEATDGNLLVTFKLVAYDCRLNLSVIFDRNAFSIPSQQLAYLQTLTPQ